MKKIALILTLIPALWNILPTGSSFGSLFDLVGEDLGTVVATSEPDPDPILIITPPPR